MTFRYDNETKRELFLYSINVRLLFLINNNLYISVIFSINNNMFIYIDKNFYYLIFVPKRIYKIL